MEVIVVIFIFGKVVLNNLRSLLIRLECMTLLFLALMNAG